MIEPPYDLTEALCTVALVKIAKEIGHFANTCHTISTKAFVKHRQREKVLMQSIDHGTP